MYYTPRNEECQAIFLILGYNVFMTKFKERLKELRIEKELSQSELGKKLGVDFRTVSNWENGVRKPDIDTLAKIAEYLEVSSDYLLGLVD